MTTEKLVETVTISFERYKELEKKEKAFDAKRGIVITDNYYSRNKEFIILSEIDGMEEIKKEIETVKRTISNLRQKESRLNIIENSFWFRLIERYIKNLKYH